uniref:Uncharacterized protein n=1 Tax=Cannabis sativa TaxID=3483 RepID=A0A803PKP7_CANSA
MWPGLTLTKRHMLSYQIVLPNKMRSPRSSPNTSEQAMEMQHHDNSLEDTNDVLMPQMEEMDDAEYHDSSHHDSGYEDLQRAFG